MTTTKDAMARVPPARRWRLGATALALALLAGPACAIGSDPAAVPNFARVDSLEARVQGCVTCHGQQGQGTASGYFPRIAGKPAGYLFNQLRAFRDGTRRYVPMNYLVAYLPDAYLREIADYFSKLRPAFAAFALPPVAPEVRARGQHLVTAGDPQRQIPPCVACHGQRLTGMEPGVPALVGLRPAYITAQLTRWRTGERRAAEPDCMHRIADRLHDQDIVGVAAWLGSLPAPADLAPQPRDNVRMPLACGSEP